MASVKEADEKPPQTIVQGADGQITETITTTDGKVMEVTYRGDFYEEVSIDDMEYDDEEQVYSYPCPCGDKFTITLEDVYDGEIIAYCKSCTLKIKVLYDPTEFQEDEGD